MRNFNSLSDFRALAALQMGKHVQKMRTIDTLGILHLG